MEKEFSILTTWMEKGYLKEEKDTLKLTAEGMALSDDLGPQLISSEVIGRMEEWENKFFTEALCPPATMPAATVLFRSER